jgi:large subunit ribosomal protein L24
MKEWSPAWKSSTKPRKQRKYRATAPLHVKRRFLAAHLAPELRKKYSRRSLNPIEGDKVKVMRGQFKNHQGKIEKVDTKYSRVIVSGIEITKKDGSKTIRYIHPSNIMIMELKLDDKMRAALLDRKKK